MGKKTREKPETGAPGAGASSAGRVLRLNVMLPIIIFVVMGMSFAVIAIFQVGTNARRVSLDKRIIDAETNYNYMLENDTNRLGQTIDAIMLNKDIREALIAKDREKLLALSASQFENFRDKYATTHFYYMLPDRTVLLRVHNPSRYGDVVDRLTTLEAAITGKPSSGIEYGPYHTFTLRVVHPWYVGDELIGFVELGEEIGHIAPTLAQLLDCDFIFTLSKKGLDRAKWEEGLRMIGRTGDWDRYKSIVVTGQTRRSFSDAVRARIEQLSGVHKKGQLGILFADGNKHYGIGVFGVRDMEETERGHMVVLVDLTRDVAFARRVTTILLHVLIGSSLLLLLLLSRFLRSAENTIVDYESTLQRNSEELVLLNMQLREDIEVRKRLEEKLVERSTELDLIFNSAPVVLILTDGNARIEKYNKAGAVLMDCSPDNVSGRLCGDVLKCVTTADGTECGSGEACSYCHFRNSVEETYRTGKSIGPIEVELNIDDGEARSVRYYIINTSYMTLGGEGKVLICLSDITEQKAIRDTLQKNDELLRDFLDSANDMIQIVAPDGGILYTNNAWRETLGYTEEEVASLNIRDIIHADSLPHCMELLEKMFSGENIDFIDTVFVTKYGDRIDVEGNINCRFEEGRPVSTRGIFRNVTERNMMLSELRESESNLNSIMENSPNIISLKDITGNYIFVNRVFEKVFDISRDDIVSGNDYNLFPPEIASVIRKSDMQVVKSGKQMEFEETVFVGNSLQSYLTVKFPILDSLGNSVAICSMGTDISSRKEIEDALKSLAGETASYTGEMFFKVLAKSLARVFSARYAFIARCDPDRPDKIRTIVFCDDGRYVENIEYVLEGTPCGEVCKTRRIVLYAEHVRKHFVDDESLADLNIESYLGAPVLDASGNLCGIIAVMDDSPMRGVESKFSIIEVFAMRTGAEIDRLDIEKELRNQQDILEETVEERTAELAVLNEQLSRFSRKLIRAQEKERANLSRELHDQIGQLITALSMGLQWLRIQPGLDQNRVTMLADITEKISIETRRICKGLRPLALDRLGLLRAIEELTRETFEHSGINPSVSIRGIDEDKIHPDVEIDIFRIVQEAFTNIVKYSDADNVFLSFSMENEELILCIKDDGVGAGDVKTHKRGLGIMGMKERAEMFGGSLVVSSGPGKGTELLLRIPFDRTTDGEY